MAYEPYTWKQSEVITSERLNYIESGISELDTAAQRGLIFNGDINSEIY